MQNHFYFSKPSNSWKEQKNTFISKIDSVHSTKLIVMVVPHFTCDIIMVPFATCAPNIANISCWKLHSNHSCILIKEAYWIIMHLYLVKQFKIFFNSRIDSCIGIICHHKDFTGQVLIRKTLFHPETTNFNTKKDFFWQGTNPQMGPICSEWYSQSDHWKILEPPWSVLDTEPHGLKTLDITPKCGIKPLTIPLHSPNGWQMPAFSAVQGDCLRVYWSSVMSTSCPYLLWFPGSPWNPVIAGQVWCPYSPTDGLGSIQG